LKQTNLFAAVSISMLFVIPAFASNDIQALTARLAKDSSPENVKAVALKQKTMNCEQNAKNKKLQDSQKLNYISACLNKNEALLAYSSLNNQQYASSDVNKILQQAPTAAGSN